MEELDLFARPDIPVERQHYLKGFMPLVRFVIPDDRHHHDYRRHLTALLADFMEYCDPRNADSAKVIRIRGEHWNQESGIGGLWIDKQFVGHCKMYLYDGEGNESRSPLSNWEVWRGIMFRDHGERDCRFWNTVKVFLIADAFESFLNEHGGIAFERHNMEGER